MIVVMHIVENTSRQGKKIYNSILLRESYREDGKVKKRTIANLSHCSPKEISAIKLALQHKDNLSALGSIKDTVHLQEGLSVGAVWAVYQMAQKLHIDKALGSDFNGKLALWQIIARVINQGSRLSTVRLAQTHAACDILQIRQRFDENTLYHNLSWLADNQQPIEDRLLRSRRDDEQIEIFLYDVTSSYLEGEKNYFGAYGYPRDGKKGKKQIVIGMLCDEHGDPVSTEVFSGNTQDPSTFASQVEKAAKRFGCKRVTFVGDRGMIKSTQIDNLPTGFHYITAITKPQVTSLINNGLIQLSLFDKEVCEVHDDNGVRYILRRNPIRQEEIRRNRHAKQQNIDTNVEKKNIYLQEHPKAKVETALKEITNRIKKLKTEKWLKVEATERCLLLHKDEDALAEVELLDGCYVIKTDLPQNVGTTRMIHDRYKDLALVEQAFRSCKTMFLEVRPIYVRTEKSTQGHVLVVMLAYMLARHLGQRWQQFDLTVEEGLKKLSTLCSMEVCIKNHSSCLQIPTPREESQKLLEAIDVRMPIVLPHADVPVVTRKKLQDQRKKL